MEHPKEGVTSQAPVQLNSKYPHTHKCTWGKGRATGMTGKLALLPSPGFWSSSIITDQIRERKEQTGEAMNYTDASGSMI